jgi:hypothetical protein
MTLPWLLPLHRPETGGVALTGASR